MDELQTKRKSLQETMNILASMAFGMEQAAGRGANGTAYMAGRKLGQKLSANAKKTDDVDAALKEVQAVLQANDCLWGFETFKPKGQDAVVVTAPDGSQELKLVFRDCMIRQALFRYGHEQKNSLCYMMYGFFSGALEHILGKKVQLDIIHAGENACLKSLKIKAGG